MAQQFATGSVHVFLAPPNRSQQKNTPVYFGTCESMPQDQRQPEYEMLWNDISGSKVPLDLAWEGESAQISLTMTRVDQVVVEYLQAHPNTPTATPGSWAFEDVGSMMGLEGLAWECWLVYTFGSAIAGKLTYTGAGLRPGRHYTQCVLWSPQSEETGTKPTKQHFMLFAWPKPNFGTKRFVLYDYDMTGISSNLIT